MSLPSIPISEQNLIYPDKFFSYSIKNDKILPSNPILEVGFRKSVSIRDLSNPDAWDDISYTSLVNNNFLASCQVEDSGGAQNLTLTMFDYNMSGLENKVVRAIALINIARSSRGSVVETGANNTEVSGDNGTENIVNFFVGGVDDIHLRVRFGYGFDKKVLDDDTYSVPLSKTDESFLNRTVEQRTSLKSPWLYFQLLDAKFDPEMEGGMRISLKGISTGQTFLNKIKILQRFAIIKGKPLSLITFLGSALNQVSESKIRIAAPGAEGKFIKSGNGIQSNIENPKELFTENDPTYRRDSQWSDEPDVLFEETRDNSENKEREISITLGGVPRMEAYTQDGDSVTYFRPIQSFKSIREILNELCSNVPKRYILEYSDGRQETRRASELLTSDESVLPIKRTISYSWSSSEYIDPTDDQLKTKIFFNYKDPEASIRAQPYFRVYEYGNSPRSIVLNCSVSSSIDFASLNMALKSPDGILTSSVNQDSEGTGTTGSFVISNEVDTLTDWGQNPIFVTNVVDQDSGNENIRNTSLSVLSEIVGNVNNQPFKGTITLLGDPFYFFDDKIRPYEYSIFLDIKRPIVVSSTSSNGETEETKVELFRSYLSGFYTITKITHTFGVEGFYTNLEIAKFPTAETVPTASQIQQRT